MSSKIILKQESASSIESVSAGYGTIFVDSADSKAKVKLPGSTEVLASESVVDNKIATGAIAKASTAEAIEGLDNTKYMTALATKNAISNGYDYEYSPSFMYHSTTGLKGGITSGSSAQLYDDGTGAGIYRFYFTGVNGDIKTFLPLKTGTNINAGTCPSWDSFSIMEVEFAGGFNNPNMSIGFGEGSGVAYPVTDTGRKVFLSTNVSSEIRLNSGDNVTQSYGAAMVSNPIVANKYKVIYTVGVNIKLYINGTLADTKTTNLPSGTSDVYFMLGSVTTNSMFHIQDLKIKLKYS